MKNAPHPIDTHVGLAIMSSRKMVGMSQSEAARRLGISFQQLSKYEHGTNRVSASRLYEIAELFAVSPCDFFPRQSSEKPQPLATATSRTAT